jgi:putative ABC transport system permease protein
MRWSLLEMWRLRGRFAGMTVTIAALSALAILLVAMSAGLWSGATGAVERSSATLMVFSRDSLGTFARSRLARGDMARIAAVPGVSSVGALGTLAVTAATPHGTVDVEVMGDVPGGPGAPAAVVAGRLPGPGESGLALADVALRNDGVRLGATLRTDAGTAVRIVGFVADERFGFQPTLWTTIATWQAMTERLQPETRGLPPYAQVLTVGLAPGATPPRAARAIASAVPATVVTREQAALLVPGARQMRSTIDELIAAALGVAGVVAGFFFALLAAQREGELLRLRALGMGLTRLVAVLLLQGETAVTVAVACGYALAIPIVALAPAAFPVTLTITSAVGLGAAFLLAGAIGTTVPLIRIGRLDPAVTLGEA